MGLLLEGDGLWLDRREFKSFVQISLVDSIMLGRYIHLHIHNIHIIYMII